jgi:tetratricopeptide (TPR) repeat protein
LTAPKNNDKLKKLLNEGLACIQASNFKEAEKLFTNAVNFDPLNFDALYLLGVTHASQNNLENAACILQKALEINRSHADANFNLGIVLEKLGKVCIGICKK